MAEPTKGLRLEVYEGGDLLFTLESKMAPLFQTDEQRKVDVTYINWLIETDERRREHLAKYHSGVQEVLVDMGDMSRASIDTIPLDSDYESMTEDFLQGFNHVVMQGIKPIRALYAMSQAFAIVLGYALRASMPWPVAQAILSQIMKSASAAEKAVRIVTSPSSKRSQ